MKDQWYHNAIIYSLDVETYKDSNGDGIGDFAGLVSKLDHLSGLGINCLWLRPFFPSPLVDDGYDVMEYFDIDHRFGNLGDFVDFVLKARALGIRVIIDLVVNHTSDKHVWFKNSRKNKDSKYRDYYIWKKKPTKKEQAEENMLTDGGIWEYDPEAEAYYMHHFYKEQPDLNIANPEVRKEIKKIMGFWLQLGVSGFRIDSAHILVHETKDKVFEMLEEMRNFLSSRNSEAVLLGEANVTVNDFHKFFSNGNKRLHFLFNFYTNKNLFLSFVRRKPEPLISALQETKVTEGEWVNFIRTHDELNLEMLSEDERNEVFEMFAPDEKMRLFGHGIRRRLPPMLNGDRKKMELIYCIMFSLPGLPLINYGEEIAMGDDLSLKGRESLRTVMQWDGHNNAGFSDASKDKLVHPVIDSGDYDFREVNVSRQQKDPDSFMNWMARLISTRKHSPQLSFGECKILKNNTGSVFSFYNLWENNVVILLHNLNNKDYKLKLDIEDKKLGSINEIFSNQKYDDVKDIHDEIDISAYGYRWFKCIIIQ
jgi:maltose alpha-D-glucosyltransferase / alpha-amylase